MNKAIQNEQSEICCSLCGSSGLHVFYEMTSVPASCNLLWTSKEEAINCPKGNIKLAFCSFCTFIANYAVEPEKNQYGHLYDNSLFYSQHFQNFAKKLAANLTQRYDLHNKTLVEVGCGKVDFLSFFCELGGNIGLRLNPAQLEGKGESLSENDLNESTPRFYWKPNEGRKIDFVFSYHELEHLNYPKRFLSVLRQIIGSSPHARVFFAVPNALKAFEEGDFTDIIYEHVSYFTIPSLFYLFSSCGFSISRVSESVNEIFDSIYVAATPNTRTKPSFEHNSKTEAGEIKRCIASFAAKSAITIEKYSSRVKQLLDKGKRVVVWGAGARGVTLLNILKDPRIEYAIDINPRKQGKYVPGTGQRIVEPKFLLDYQPDYLILANPAYENEIRQIMSKLQIKAEFIIV